MVENCKTCGGSGEIYRNGEGREDFCVDCNGTGKSGECLHIFSKATLLFDEGTVRRDSSCYKCGLSWDDYMEGFDGSIFLEHTAYTPTETPVTVSSFDQPKQDEQRCRDCHGTGRCSMAEMLTGNTVMCATCDGTGDYTPDPATRQLAEAQARIKELEEALREARPYVPEHHGPVIYKIEKALKGADNGQTRP